MIMLMVAAMIGGSVTLATLWPYGVFTAFIGAPFGGSLLALLAGLFLAFLRIKAEQMQERSVQAPQNESKAAA